jgi:hypothetical protein
MSEQQNSGGMHAVVGIIVLVTAGEGYLSITQQHCIVFTVFEGDLMQFYKRLMLFF